MLTGRLTRAYYQQISNFCRPVLTYTLCDLILNRMSACSFLPYNTCVAERRISAVYVTMLLQRFAGQAGARHVHVPLAPAHSCRVNRRLVWGIGAGEAGLTDACVYGITAPFIRLQREAKRSGAAGSIIRQRRWLQASLGSARVCYVV